MLGSAPLLLGDEQMPVDCRDGLSSTPVASLYSWSGDSRRTFSSSAGVGEHLLGAWRRRRRVCTESAITPAISPANSVSTSQIAIAASAAVAARRQTTDSSSDSASHSEM